MVARAGALIVAPDFPLSIQTMWCTADTTRNNSTTLLNVTGMSVSLAASGTYLVDGALAYTTGATPDIKFAFSTTGSPAGWWSLMPVTAGSTGTIGDIVAFRDTSFTAAQSAGGSDTLSGNCTCMPKAYVVTTAAATMQLQFAQNTANASDTIVRVGAWMRFTRVA